MAWQKCQPTHKEGKGWIEEGKVHTQARPSQGKKQDMKNESPMTHPRHKRSKMSSRTCSKNQKRPQVMANAWTAGKPWTHMEVEHPQGSGTTHLYPTNTGVVGHNLEIREGIVWWWGEGESLLWGSYSSSFGGNVLLGWHTTQKREKWVEITRCMP